MPSLITLGLLFVHSLAWALPAQRPHYRIEARLIPQSKRIAGQVRIRFFNSSNRPLAHLRMHLYLNAFARPDTLFMRSSGRSFRGQRAILSQPGWIRLTHVAVGGKPTVHRKLYDGTVAQIPLPVPLPPGKSTTISATFAAQLPRIFARTGHAGRFFMVGQWYPKLGFLRQDGSWQCRPFHAQAEFFAPFADYDVRLDVPLPYRVGATGQRVQRVARGRTQQLYYRAHRVHDFAFAAWPYFVETVVNEQHVRIHLLSVPGRHRAARQLLLIRTGLRRLQRWFGRYPYPELTIIDVPLRARGAHGMEYPTLFTSLFPRWVPDGIHVFEELLLHELTHQYFQGLVATNEVEEPWMDEGLTTFVSGILLDEIFGNKRSYAHLFGLELGQRQKNMLLQLRASPRLPVAQPGRRFSNWNAYAAVVYGRTASLLYTLDNLLGRSRLLAALGSYARHYTFQHPTGNDLRRQILHHTPRPLSAVIEQLLQGVLDRGQMLDYRLICASDAVVVRREGALYLPLTIHWKQRGRAPRARRYDGVSRSMRIQAPDLERAYIGPAARLSLDAVPLDNACTSTNNAYKPASLIAAVIQHLLQLVGP